MKLKDKVAIVTGGASGIGRAICLGMANEGADVVVADIAVEEADKVVNEVKAIGRKAIAVKVDITKSQEANQMAKTVLDEFGKIDILVNNAGGSAGKEDVPFYESTEDTWDWVIALNLKGARNCTRVVINHMIEKRSGKIVSIASVSGVIGTVPKYAYSAAKAGVIGFTKVLAKEMASYGVHVNSVSPGSIETPLFLLNTEEFIEKVRKGTPLGRLGKPEEIANMVVFLASDDASYITGQNFIVDGGRTLGA